MQSLVSKDRLGQHRDVRAGAGALSQPCLRTDRKQAPGCIDKGRASMCAPAREIDNGMVSVRVEDPRSTPAREFLVLQIAD